jgi:hypothetical protein
VTSDLPACLRFFGRKDSQFIPTGSQLPQPLEIDNGPICLQN